MKFKLLALWLSGGVVQVMWSLVDGLDKTFQVVIEGGAAAGVIAAGWRWFAGPCWRRARSGFGWVHDRLEMLEVLKPELADLRTQLAGIHDRLDRGEERFERIDEMFKMFASEDAQLVRQALREGTVVPIVPQTGGPERRSMG